MVLRMALFVFDWETEAKLPGAALLKKSQFTGYR